ETEEDFQGTMDIVRRARFSAAYTFQYSPRPGTPAATMDEQVPKHVVQERFARLIKLQDEIAAEENATHSGKGEELLVEAEGINNNDKHRLRGRASDGRLVHFAPDANGEDISEQIRPGDIVHTTITDAGYFFLIADEGVASHRRTKAGDMSALGQTPTTQPIGVGLGFPKIGKPAEQPASSPARGI